MQSLTGVAGFVPDSNNSNDKTVPEEIPSEKEFYNGGNKLNIKIQQIGCSSYVRNDCLTHSNCGWCGSSNSCIIGSRAGPLSPCDKATFVYVSTPGPFGQVNLNGFESPTIVSK